MTLNIDNPPSVHVNEEDLPITENFTSLGSTVSNKGRVEMDTNNNKQSKKCFRSLNNV